MEFNIPGTGSIEIGTIILDLNGTVTVNGRIVRGLKRRLKRLKKKGIRVIILSGDTRGNASRVADRLGIELIKAATQDEKEKAVLKLDPSTCASIGNGLIDAKTIECVQLGIVTMQSEGVHVQTLQAADIVVPSVIDALDLFIHEKRLVATLRK